jgi:hypothetical protein
MGLGVKKPVCEQCRKPMSYVQNRELDGKPKQGEWLHDDGSARCVISKGGLKSRVAGPVTISNEALFAALKKYESRLFSMEILNTHQAKKPLS